MKRLLVYLMLVSPAYAAHCPYGQIYRVHLDECVSWHSALARAYVGRKIYVPKLPIKRETIIIPATVHVDLPTPEPVSIYPPEIIYRLQKALDALHQQ
jgi:hypothetical protein